MVLVIRGMAGRPASLLSDLLMLKLFAQQRIKWQSLSIQVIASKLKVEKIDSNTNNFPGFQMPSWFDLYSLDPSGKEDEAGIKSAFKLVNSMISEEVKSGIPSERIILGGFSQGGAIALYTALNTELRLGGVVALSCWVPLHKQLNQAEIVNKDTPVLQAHGDADQVVPHKWGQLSSQMVKSVLTKHNFRTYQGLPHSSNAQEMDDVKDFLTEHLP